MLYKKYVAKCSYAKYHPSDLVCRRLPARFKYCTFQDKLGKPVIILSSFCSAALLFIFFGGFFSFSFICGSDADPDVEQIDNKDLAICERRR